MTPPPLHKDQSTTMRQQAMDEDGDGCSGVGMVGLLCCVAEMGISDMPPLSSPSPPTPPAAHSTCTGHSLFMSFFPDTDGRELAAARELRKGELILRVPEPLC